jgi:hypothetical protein
VTTPCPSLPTSLPFPSGRRLPKRTGLLASHSSNAAPRSRTRSTFTVRARRLRPKLRIAERWSGEEWWEEICSFVESVDVGVDPAAWVGVVQLSVDALKMGMWEPDLLHVKISINGEFKSLPKIGVVESNAAREKGLLGGAVERV